MKNFVFFLISLGLIIPGYSFAATQDIHIEWTYNSGSTDGRNLAGYDLYQEGTKICTTNTPTDRSMDCTFESEDGLFDFTLVSFFTDGFKSPHSSPYSFTLASTSQPEVLEPLGNIQTSLTDITEEISTIIRGTAGSNVSTNQENVILPTPASQISASNHDIHIQWTYDFQPDNNRTLAGYYLYKEGTKICTSNSPSDSNMDCTFESKEGTFDFTLTAFCTDGYESPHSSPYTFTLTSSSDPDLLASFKTTPLSLSGNTPFTVYFDSSASKGDIASFSWDFGDNKSGLGIHKKHIYTQAGTFNATLTVTSTNGATSQQSVSITATSPTAPPVAIITPGTFTGDAPLTTSFDGSSSTSASSYTWAFGDGSTANGSKPIHTFTTPGTFTTTLTVTNATGQKHSSTTIITVKKVTTDNTPPTAVILSSTAMGEAPLSIAFDGSKSHDRHGSIKSFLWNFGDGSQTTTTVHTSHNYTKAGTYSTSLTVTDNQGATNTISTPVIITGQTEENQQPTARLTASVVNGSTPLKVIFNGSTSSDPEHAPLSFNWNFGDGATGQGMTQTHVYNSPGTFTATLTVTDNMGSTSSASTIISTEGTPDFQIELGEVELTHEWIRVDFENSFTNPIVVAGAPSYNENDPCVIRLKNITSTGFDIRIQEWNYLNATHNKELVAYLVMEQGSFTLDDGTMIETGKFESNDTKFQTIQFNTAFKTKPVVMTSFTTFNEEDAVTGRLQNISTTSFAHKMQEQESLGTHGNETGNYIAWEASKSTIGNINVIVAATPGRIRNSWYTIDYGEQLSESPVFIGTMQSQNGIDTAAIRYTNKTNYEIQVKVEEEKSADSETRHAPEAVGYFLFSANNATNDPNENTPPTAIFSASDTSGSAPLNVTFDASKSSDDGEIVSYDWDFGDGATGSGVLVNHTYTRTGDFITTLTVTDAEGNPSTIAKKGIKIVDSSIVYKINFQPKTALAPEGYLIDTGQLFDPDKGYGWIEPTRGWGNRDSNSGLSLDQSYDTMIVTLPTSLWEIDIPNGTYEVTLCIGDPSYALTMQNVQIEESNIIRNENNSNAPGWIERTKEITITDAKLSLSFAGTIKKSQLCWIKIAPIK